MPVTRGAAQPPIVGYVTPLRGRPGSRLEFKISSAGDAPFSAHVVRIDCADPNPDGPGMKCVPVDFELDADPRPGLYQTTQLGSYGIAPIAPIKPGDDFVVELGFQSLLVKEDPQALVSIQDEGGSQGVVIAVANGELVLHGLDRPGDAALLATGLGVDRGAWYFIRAAFSRDGVDIELIAHEHGTPAGTARAKTPLPADWRGRALDRVLVAGARRGDRPFWFFDGRIEAPGVSLDGGARCIARWDFSSDMEESCVANTVDQDGGMRLINAPMRAVRGMRWSGLIMDWKDGPEEYAAIHFHADDLSDCGWETSLVLRIPQSARSAVYGLVVDNGQGRDTIPFFVVPAKSGPHARVAYLASTLTYLAYGNHARGNYPGALAERIERWGAYPHNPDRVPQFGLSTYNRHPDGSGVSLSSRLRPLLTMRPGYLTFADSRGSGLRHFPADSHLTDWLAAKGIAYDVITDEDLHEEGAEVLAPYDLLLTGSHPEYHTRAMLEALIDFRRNGGHLAYLGGNGFYWKIALGGADDELLEIRRAEGGVRAWASEPGEYYHQLDGGYGGLWRRNGLAPQAVGGVGFTVQGEFEGSHYRRTPESRDAGVAWLFDGVKDETFGGFGLSGGGAAGFELDQADQSLGTPDHAVVVAVSEQHGPSFKTAPEEILTWTLPGASERAHPGICSHMIYAAPREGWGSLFAVGSITFLGSLSHDGYANDVSKVLENYIGRVLQAAG
ncbi:N,N-dimethylformamidase beta subunit family domain-containing protein [Castellaniella sp. GW247-6E4]|uniref:N,N-dimethylformamidase beta subunit family domain-containing protein n=1 Tax=Castellaniella sp. GW247-6E4 TaxID=3140380 RepID=UPI003316236A